MMFDDETIRFQAAAADDHNFGDDDDDLNDRFLDDEDEEEEEEVLISSDDDDAADHDDRGARSHGGHLRSHEIVRADCEGPARGGRGPGQPPGSRGSRHRHQPAGRSGRSMTPVTTNPIRS